MNYPPPSPLPLPPTFNPIYFEVTNFLTISQADARYLSKTNPIISGNLTVSGTTISNTYRADDGTPTNPAYSFTTANNMGMYFAAARLSFAYNGGIRLSIDNSNVVFHTSRVQAVGRGTVLSPFYTFQADTSAGLWLDNTGNTCLSTGGVQQLALSTSNILASSPIIAPDGTVANPAYSFSNSQNSGMYYTGAAVAFSVGGALRLLMDASNNVLLGVRLRGSDGSQASPFYTFNSDPTMGMFRAGTNTLGLTVGGVQQLALSTSNILASSPFIIPNGTLAVPGLAFTTTQNTGLSFVGQDFQLGYGGIQRLAMNTKGTVIGKPSGGTEMTFIRRIAPTATITLNSNTSGTITIPIGVTLANTNYDVHINIISVSGPADHMTYAYDSLTTTDFRVVYKNNGSGSVDFQIQCYLYGY